MNEYRWDAQDYEKYSSQQQQWARELIQKLALRGSEMLLDIGCGDGKVTAEIAACLDSGRVVGIDNSEAMISLARQRYPPMKFPNLTFQLGDARHLPFNEEYNLVFSNAALHWIRDHLLVLVGIYNSLVQDGRILLQMGGAGNAAGVVAVLNRLTALPQYVEYFEGFEFPYGFYSPEIYTQWLLKVGLKPIRVELIPKDMIHENVDGFSGWIRTTWLPYTQRLPENKREGFIADLVAAYLAENPQDKGGRVHVAMVRLEVEGVKPASY